MYRFFMRGIGWAAAAAIWLFGFVIGQDKTWGLIFVIPIIALSAFNFYKYYLMTK